MSAVYTVIDSSGTIIDFAPFHFCNLIEELVIIQTYYPSDNMFRVIEQMAAGIVNQRYTLVLRGGVDTASITFTDCFLTSANWGVLSITPRQVEYEFQWRHSSTPPYSNRTWTIPEPYNFIKTKIESELTWDWKKEGF